MIFLHYNLILIKKQLIINDFFVLFNLVLFLELIDLPKKLKNEEFISIKKEINKRESKKRGSIYKSVIIIGINFRN